MKEYEVKFQQAWNHIEDMKIMKEIDERYGYGSQEVEREVSISNLKKAIVKIFNDIEVQKAEEIVESVKRHDFEDALVKLQELAEFVEDYDGEEYSFDYNDEELESIKNRRI